MQLQWETIVVVGRDVDVRMEEPGRTAEVDTDLKVVVVEHSAAVDGEAAVVVIRSSCKGYNKNCLVNSLYLSYYSLKMELIEFY